MEKCAVKGVFLLHDWKTESGCKIEGEVNAGRKEKQKELNSQEGHRNVF